MADDLRVTDVRLWKSVHGDKMKALATVVLNDQFVIHGIRIIEGQKGLFIAMPSKRMPGGGFKDICHPINPGLRNHLQQKILQAYAAENVITKIERG